MEEREEEAPGGGGGRGQEMGRNGRGFINSTLCSL